MGRVLFMAPVLERLSQPKFLGRIFAIVFRVFAVVIGLAGLVSIFGIGALVAYLPPFDRLGGILIIALTVLAIVVVIEILLIRANDIGDSASHGYVITSVLSICLKVIGEIYATIFAMVAFATGLLAWFVGGQVSLLQPLTQVLPGAQSASSLSSGSTSVLQGLGATTFVTGLMTILSGLIVAFFTLVFFYFLSECVMVLADIATNMRVTRRIAEQYDRAGELRQK